MKDIRAELEQIIIRFMSEVVAAAQTAPLNELLAELGGPPRVVADASPVSAGVALASELASPGAPRLSGHQLRRLKTLERALEWQAQLEGGAIGTRAQIARREGLSRAAVTQTFRLLRGLAADDRRLLAKVLAAPGGAGRDRERFWKLMRVTGVYSGRAR